MPILYYFLLFLLGLATGFYSGLIGSGGNVIMIPALDYIFQEYGIEGIDSVKYLIAHSLFITIFLGFSVSLKHYRIDNFYPKEVLKIGIPGMLSAYWVSEIISNSTWYQKSYFEGVFLVMLLLLAIRMIFVKEKVKNTIESFNSLKHSFLFAFLGLLTGCVTSLSGLGGGVVLIPFLTDIMRVTIKKASSVSIGVITLLAIAVSTSYLFAGTQTGVTHQLPLQTGYVSILIAAPILGGIFIASSFGVRAAQKASPQYLRIVFGVIIMLLCAKMIYGLIS